MTRILCCFGILKGYLWNAEVAEARRENKQEIRGRETMQPSPEAHSAGWKWPVLMAFVRLPMVMVGSGIAVLAYRIAGETVGIAAGLAWSTLTLTVVNGICLGLLVWRGHVEGFSLLEAIDFRPQRLVKDLIFGVVWSVVLGVMMLIGVFCVVMALHSSEGFAAFETSFTGTADFSLQLPVWLAVWSAVVFPVLNAPIEELQYRGYSQAGLIAAFGRPRLGIIVTAVGFGLQHAVFAVTLTAALAYVTGFFLWGLGAGLIAYRQQRLAPLIVAHYLSNLSFGVIPLIIVIRA